MLGMKVNYKLIQNHQTDPSANLLPLLTLGNLLLSCLGILLFHTWQSRELTFTKLEVAVFY